MADKRTTPEVPQNEPEDAGFDASQDANLGARRKKRAAPTIDLTASEVLTAKPAEPSPAPEPPPAAAESPPADPHASRLGANINVTTYIAGAVGAVAMTFILGVLWLTGLLPVRYETAIATDSKAIRALNERVGKIDETVAKLPKVDAGMADRLAAAENAMKPLGIALTALNHRTDDIADIMSQARERADKATKDLAELQASVQNMAKNIAGGLSSAELDNLQKRIGELEQSAKSTRADIAKTATADMAARLALSAAALRNAVVSGAPYAAELAQAKALGADEKDLASLAPFTGSGVPSAQSLAQELRTLLPAMLKLSGTQAPSGFIERLEANAGKLVRIRPVDAPPGDDASSVLARVEIDAAKADISAALSDLGKLNETTRAPAQAWIAKAQARETALADARRYAVDTARALGPTSGPKARTR
ncbi:MAG TPA: hypothetical protein VIJ52_09175 [Pseudolabrys sp.]